MVMERAKNEGLAAGLKEGKVLGLEQGREEGIEEGIEQGIEQGLELGLEKGREEGVKKAKRLIVQNLLSTARFTTMEIANFADVSEDFVIHVKESMS